MKKTLFCDGWEFCKTKIGTEYDDACGWAAVTLPHDWLIYNTEDLYETSTGWYRRHYNYRSDGGRTALRFEGVYMDCRIYVNGKQAGEWKYGYTTFSVDITDLLCEGDNIIAVRVDHREPNSRWYSGAGIYRNVWLCRYPETHILADGVYVSADISGSVTVTTETERPEGESSAGLSLKTIIYKQNGDKYEIAAELESECCAADKSVIAAPLRKEGCSYTVNTQILNVSEPHLWDIEDPQLYLCTVMLMRNGECIDIEGTEFGFRSIEFTADRGFFLNGRHLKLHGCCEHHDLGALGAAVNRAAIRRKLTILRGMGINAIRTSHNPPAVELLDLADEMGFLILDEGFDMWEMKKTEYDYSRFFGEWIERDAAAWVRRDRNRPCLIGWSIGNEIYDTHASSRGQEVTSLLKRLVALHDPRGNGYVTIGSNYMSGDGAQRCADILKVAGYNYAERLYDEHHAAHPDWMIYGSETSSVVQSRGIYHFPQSQPILCDDDEQCSSLGNSAPIWAAKRWEDCILPDRDREYCAGQFIWTGFDYIGEPTPYSTKNSYFGQTDTAGFPKDSYYVFRSAWTDYKRSPFVHIFPYWDFNEGELIDIRVASNAPEVALLFNGTEVARRRIDRLHGKEITLDVTLPYSPGELTAVAYDENGCEIARDVQASFGDTAQLRLTADREVICADKRDLCFVEIAALDSEGRFVANARDRVKVAVEGEGILAGLDNGDSTDYEQYKGTSRRLFSGKLLCIIAATDKAGDIKITVSAPGLPDSSLSIRSSQAENTAGTELMQPCTPRPLCVDDPDKDIPIRKIELSAERKEFDPEHKILTFAVKILPHNAVFGSDIEYRLITSAGIDSPIAKIVDSSPEKVTVECLGDGEFYLRALCKNGTKKYSVMSDLHLTANGIGSVLIDPYSMVAGGLYSISGGEVTTGIDHGAGITGKGGWFGFENVDLGTVGSDRITIPLFANYAYPVKIKLWDGIPDDGGELLGEFEYDLPPIWLTYQPMTYQLPRVLTGIHTICIQSDIPYDVGGFMFEKRAKEKCELFAVNAVNVYGDKFEKTDEALVGIGNNVTVAFGEFDFAEPPERICITGKSALESNSIHILFEGDDGDVRILAEFPKAEKYTEREFAVSGISGHGKVSLIFLPGSDFDLMSIRFA